MGVNREVQEKLAGFQPKLIVNQPGHYCPGCQYGVLTRLLAEVIEELGIEGDIIGVSAVGCSIFIHSYLDIDFIDALHGRAPEVASGVKAANFGKKIVFTLQGDGDLAAIGMGDLINAMARGEHLTTIFLNNANYGTLVRGGDCEGTAILSDEPIHSPLIYSPSSLIIMSMYALDSFTDRIRPGCLLILDSSLISEPPDRDDVELVQVPATQQAADLGSSQSANFLMLGAYLRKSDALGLEQIEDELTKAMVQDNKEAFLSLNLEALQWGYQNVA